MKKKRPEAEALGGNDTSSTLLPGALPITVDGAAHGILSGASLDAVVLVGPILTLRGWVLGCDRVDLLRDGVRLRARISRVPRPDVSAVYADAVDEAPGFEIVFSDTKAGRYQLRCVGFGGAGLVRDFDILVETGTDDDAPALGTLPKYFEDPHSVVGAIDKAFDMAEGGAVVFGWFFDIHSSLESISLHSEARAPLDLTDNFFRLARLDVEINLKTRYPHVTEMTGFVIHIPSIMNATDDYGLCFDCGDRGKAWLKVEVDGDELTPLQRVKNILTYVPAPDRIRHSLYDLFDKVLGEPISAIAPSIMNSTPTPSVRQFGEPAQAPEVSVVVPLYGRYDFLKFQMARFRGDPDFDAIDLIYVVDDPSILSETLEMAAAQFEIFQIPFRVVWYHKNLGFAGANNVGASLARGAKFLALNSDVIPQEPGWISELARTLDEPGVGAVGPLLQFFDGSVQHAGMRPKEDPFYPGFILNVHPGKGAPWWGSDDAYEVPLLTAACLMLRTSDFHALGGFDEGYIIGDFEDSDLCLKLRKAGLQLILNAKPKLWHLERQSQNLQSITSYRHLLTLYNGWRYKRKILNAEIADPWEI